MTTAKQRALHELENELNDLLGPDPTTSEKPAETGARRTALQSLCAALDDAIGPNAAETTPEERAEVKEAQERRRAALARVTFQHRLQAASEAVAQAFSRGIKGACNED